LRIAGPVIGAFGLVSGAMMPFPDNVILVFGFGGAGLIMLMRAYTASARVADRIAGAILLVIGVACAAAFYSDTRDVSGAVVWLVGTGFMGTYLILFPRREAPPP
jgi:hypothetical protein